VRCDIIIEQILQTRGPILSGVLAQELAKHSINLTLARKQISRVTHPIKKLRLGFENNQSFVYLENQTDTKEYWENLTQCLKTSSQAYYSYLNAFLIHYGFVYKSQLTAYTFSPVQNLKGHLHSNNIVERLIKSRIISDFDENIFQINSNIYAGHNFSRFRAIELAKKQISEDFISWARNTNLISYHTARSLDTTAEFGKFQWCFTSPSYVNSISRFKKGKPQPGFIVADILIGRKLKADDIGFFLKKVEIIKQQRNVSAFIPFLICDNLEENAFKAVKSKGVITGFVRELFGAAYSETLRLLVETVTEATKIITTNPDQFIELSKKLSALQGRFGNIKGDMFEFVVGYFYTINNDRIEIGKVIKERESGKNKEIDVFVNAANQLRVVECKGQKLPVTKSFIETWLDEKITIIRKWILSQDDYCKKEIIFEIWSTSGFEKDALLLLQQRAHSVKPSKYKIEFWDKSSIVKKFYETRNAKLRDIMNDYF
jgi:hypothetical protein